MSLATQKNIGSFLSVVRGPAGAKAAGTFTGPWIDRKGFLSMVLMAQSGAVTGAPTAQRLDAKIEDATSAAGAGAADLAGAAITQITTINTAARKDVDLSGARRFIRVSMTVGFTAGTGPTLEAAANAVLGGPDVVPAAPAIAA